jgi:hypothetical protein
MTGGDGKPIAVSRRIGASAHEIFLILTDPVRHIEFDGSGMLRGAATTEPIGGVGDVFVMKMYFAEHGDYEMNNHVVEYEPDRRVGWEPEAGRGHPASGLADTGGRWGHRWSYELTPDGPDATFVTERYDCSRAPESERADMADGAVWIQAMTDSLDRLASICAGRPG